MPLPDSGVVFRLILDNRSLMVARNQRFGAARVSQRYPDSEHRRDLNASS
jgi:hypothetical protein